MPIDDVSASNTNVAIFNTAHETLNDEAQYRHAMRGGVGRCWYYGIPRTVASPSKAAQSNISVLRSPCDASVNVVQHACYCASWSLLAVMAK